MTEIKAPYSAGVGSQSFEHGKGALQRVIGPGNGLGYHSDYLWPQYTFEFKDDAIRAAEIANIAFSEGKLAAKREMREALGLS